MSSVWSSAARTLHIIEGVDHEIENTMPTTTASMASAASTVTSATTIMDPGNRNGEEPDPSTAFCFPSWPSPIMDPDWLSLETWRADEEEMMGVGGAAGVGYFHQ
jgi:hypothetical protein